MRAALKFIKSVWIVYTIVFSGLVLLAFFDIVSPWEGVDYQGRSHEKMAQVYNDKILSARSLFKQKPTIAEPIYSVGWGVYYLNASCHLDPATGKVYIKINEGLIYRFNQGELAGVIAHEIAHGEMDLGTIKKSMAHSDVDLRGAELAGKDNMISGLKRIEKEFAASYARRKMLYFLCPLWILNKYMVTKDMDDRIAIVSKYNPSNQQ